MKPLSSSVDVAAAVVDALLEVGVTDFAYCPGSRNAPFAYVLSAWERAGMLRVHPFAEERGAGFWAVGAAKAAGGTVPVAVVTTSGTAVAELHASLEEARYQELPVLALTADRPFELLGVGASQATAQAGLFGSTIPTALDIPAGDVRGVRGRVLRYLHQMLGRSSVPGPGHINVAFRDPLVPSAGVTLPQPRAGVVVTPRVSVNGSAWDEVVDPGLATVLVAGDVLARNRDQARRIAMEAQRRAVPVLAEPTSGLTDLAAWIPHAPWVLEALGGRVQQAIIIGRPTLSRAVSKLLADPEVRTIVVSEQTPWPDPSSNADVVVAGLTPSRYSPDEDGRSSSWLNLWQRASAAMTASLGGLLRERKPVAGVEELEAASLIWADNHADLWLGASNAIRAFDLAATAPGRADVFSNRGLAGIDGTIATALGFQLIRRRPIRVVLGDLTFCYDLPTLPARPDGTQDIQVIVLNDGGGRIFESLEHRQGADRNTLKRFFQVPQVVNAAAVARACGWESFQISSPLELDDALARGVKGRSVLEVKTVPPADSFDQARQRAVEDARAALT